MVLPFTSASVVIGFNPPDFRVRCDPSARRPASGLYRTKAAAICFIAIFMAASATKIWTAAGNRASFCRVAAARPRGSG